MSRRFHALDWEAPAPFALSTMALGAGKLDPVIRKARLKSKGDGVAARTRLHAYVTKDPEIKRELIRQGVRKAAFTVAATGAIPPPPIPDDMPTAPFAPAAVGELIDLVQAAADAALNAAVGDVEAARLAMWRDAAARPELADALAVLMVLALGRP